MSGVLYDTGTAYHSRGAGLISPSGFPND